MPTKKKSTKTTKAPVAKKKGAVKSKWKVEFMNGKKKFSKVVEAYSQKQASFVGIISTGNAKDFSKIKTQVTKL
jgi:hypothetical protein